MPNSPPFPNEIRSGAVTSCANHLHHSTRVGAVRSSQCNLYTRPSAFPKTHFLLIDYRYQPKSADGEKGWIWLLWLVRAQAGCSFGTFGKQVRELQGYWGIGMMMLILAAHTLPILSWGDKSLTRGLWFAVMRESISTLSRPHFTTRSR